MLKEKRIEAGMTQRRLAEAAGIPRRTIQYWEADISSAPAVSLKKVADALGCKVDDLL